MPNTTTTSPQTDQADARSYRVGLGRKASFPSIGEEVTRTLQGGAHPLNHEQVDLVSMGQDATRAVENGDTHSEGADGYDTDAHLTYLER